jgi:hypothetical protein
VGNCTVLVVCCDCNSRCSVAGKPHICICSSQTRRCPGDEGWSRWNPVTSVWDPIGDNPFVGLT